MKIEINCCCGCSDYILYLYDGVVELTDHVKLDLFNQLITKYDLEQNDA